MAPPQDTSGQGRDAQLLGIQSSIEAGDLSAAEAAAHRALAEYPHDGGVENLLGVVDVQQGKPQAALADFTRAVADSPRLVPAYLNLARLLLSAPTADHGAEEKAASLYRQVLRIEAANMEARIELATIDTRSGEYQASLALLTPLPVADRSRLAVAALLLADHAALKQRHDADQAADALLASNDFAEQDFQFVLPALQRGQRADLIDRLLTSLSARQPLNAADMRLLGLAKEAEGDSADARAALEQAYAAEPTSPVPLVDLARVAMASGDGQAALGYLAHARDLAPGDASLAYTFGLDCYKLNLLGESRKALAEAYTLAPNNATYALTLAKVTMLSQDPVKAEPFLMKYHELQPADPEALLLLGIMYYRVKDYPSATPWLKQAMMHPETAAAAYLYLGSGLREQGEYAEAQRELARSEALNAKPAEVHAQMGMVLLEGKDFSAAEKELDAAVKADPDSYTGNFGLVQLYAQTHDARRAAQMQRFDHIREQNETLGRQAMRVIEVDPQKGPQ